MLKPLEVPAFTVASLGLPRHERRVDQLAHMQVVPIGTLVRSGVRRLSYLSREARRLDLEFPPWAHDFPDRSQIRGPRNGPVSAPLSHF